MNKPELLAPAGNWPSLRAAISNGADAVYLGLKELNMRKGGAKNFSLKEIKEISKECKENKIKLYITLNTIIFDNEINKIEKIIKKLGGYVDGIIAWDLAVIKLCKKYKISCILSTQASVANELAAKEYKKLGVKRVILARELNLKQIKKINFPKEIFIHGALCYSISGRCFFSQEMYKKSANRGKCIQPCRRSYILLDPETKKEIKVKNDKFLSPKDLCCLPFLDKIVKTGACSLKIEGRGRSPEYVAIVVRVYRKALDAIFNKKFNKKLVNSLMKELKKVYNKGFSSGFYLGLPTNDDLSKIYGSSASRKKVYIGKVVNYYRKNKVAAVKIENNELNVGDEIIIIGNKTGVYQTKIKSMEIENKKVEKVKKNLVGILLNKRVRKGDKVYLWK